ncbi:MAG: hypothetical protein FGM40_08235 [Rhodocyclaceae bacterium]|nr:hypothetical protein [Rhodocyclaceae bacterium]
MSTDCHIRHGTSRQRTPTDAPAFVRSERSRPAETTWRLHMAISNPIRAASSVAAIIAGLGAALPVHAGMNMEGLLEKLRDKGVLSEDEFQEMRQEAREARRAEALDKAQAKGDKEAQKPLLQGLDPSKDGFGFKSGDGNFQIKLTGRLHSDYRWIDSGNNALAAAGRNDRDTASPADGFELRRARIGFSGFIYKDIDYLLQLNMTGNAPIVDEAYARFAFIKPAQFTFGRFKQPFSLEQLTSSNNLDFAERSYNDQNGVPAKKLGAMISGEPIKGLNYAASVFQEGFNEQSDADGSGKRYAGRLAANFGQLFNVKDTVLHVGIAGVGGDYQLRPSQSSQSTSEYESVTRASVVDFRSMNRGFQHFYRAQLAGQDLAACANVATSATSCGARNGTAGETMVNVDSRLLGLEGAVAYKSLKLQGEYVRNEINAFNPVVSGTAGTNGVGAGGTPGATTNNGSTSTSDRRQTLSGDVNTYYVQAVWNITGENWSDAYKGGVFGGIKPKSNYSTGGGWGAWQLGIRYSNVDASGINVSGSGSRIQSGRSGTTANGFLANSAENTTEVSATSGSSTVGVRTADNVNSAGTKIGSSPTRGGKMNGEVDSWGIGLNWLINPNAKMMFEYTRTMFGGPTCSIDTDVRAGTKCKDHEDLFSVRAQYNF